MKEIQITREDLYQMVWKEPITTLSKKYDISDNGIRKKCNELKIPMPNAGYWAKVKFGKKLPSKMPLKDFKGDQTITLNLIEEDEVKITPQQQILKIKNDIENDPKVNLQVNARLTNPDKLILNTRNYHYQDHDRSLGKRIDKSEILSIYVNEKHFDRALRFMDTLIKALRNRGHEFIIKYGQVHIVVFGEEYHLSCNEKYKRVMVKNKYGEGFVLERTGVLSIRLGESYKKKEWIEAKTPIEEQLSKILAGIEYKGMKEREETIAIHNHWEREKEKQRIAKELQDRKEKELMNFKELFLKSQRHEKAEIIRRYVQKLENSALQRNELTQELKKEIEWAKKKADWYDPFTESYDDLLKEVDREELVIKKHSFYLLERS